MSSLLAPGSASTGSRLSPSVRTHMERVFQTDLSGIRIHEGPAPMRLGARAFACGQHLHFAAGCYQPETPAGLWLLGHELAHVVQQRRGQATNPFGRGIARVDDPCLEAEADAWADLAVQGRPGPWGEGKPRRATAAVMLAAAEHDGPPLVLQCNDDGPAMNKWPNVVSRHRTTKRGVNALMNMGSVGIQAGGLASNTSVIGAVIAGTAVSATGIGLAVAGGALALGSMALGAKSAYSTAKHLQQLEKIYANRGAYHPTSSNGWYNCSLIRGSCGGNACWDSDVLHESIAEQILPWIIHQKKHKLGKKVGTAVGGGLAVAVWSAGRKAYKTARGTLGTQRTFFAESLAVHLITCNCRLTEAIMTELLSEAEMHALKGMDSDEAAPVIADKMKSV